MQKLYNRNFAVRGFVKGVKIFAVLFFTMLLSVTAVATVYNVNTTNDTHAVNAADGSGLDAGGNISLRSALEAADAVGGTSTINLLGVTYTLTLGQIIFGSTPENITIHGTDPLNTIISMT